MTALRQRKQGWPLEEGRSLDRWCLYARVVMICPCPTGVVLYTTNPLIYLARCWRFRSLLWQEKGLWKWHVRLRRFALLVVYTHVSFV
jgi:hypothetical protein